MSGQHISVTKKRGRPPKPPTGVVRLPVEVLEQADKWAAAQADQPSRPEAIRRLVDKGLKTT